MGKMKNQGRPARAGISLFVLSAGAAVGFPSASFASSTSGTISTLSAKLLKQPYDSLTASQKYQVICDPAEPLSGSTSILYDTYGADELGAPRVSLSGLMPGPGYRVQGLVEVEVFGSELPSLSATTQPGRQRVFQPLNEFLRKPAGFETGYAQVEFVKITGQNSGRMAPENGYTLIAEQGVVPDGVDTHSFFFESSINPDSLTENEKIEFIHFGADDSRGNFADQIIARLANGEVVITSEFDDAVVSTPEPGSLALLALGASVTLIRRRRSA